ncbi:MAG: lasso peptide biosynthesis B2 protein [Acidobacteria bacterium]|nr:lasso peptide biosynthesis B2 protein [Acidobacteriota bacterium]MBI3427877.1 lasso peptide biosynthesis B2 protein [Acidobacteriota bacterium]
MQKRIRQVFEYGAAGQNYLLLARTLHTAWLVRRQLAARQSSPQLATTIAAVEKLYLPPQPGWTGIPAETILRFAGFIVGVPLTWGRCVQKSLIAYRLLNGYGIPARFCCGVNRQQQTLDGHAWVEKLSEPGCALSESRDPYRFYLPVYTSPMPAAVEDRL